MNTKLKNYRKQLPKQIRILKVSNKNNEHFVGKIFHVTGIEKWDESIMYNTNEQKTFNINQCEPIWEPIEVKEDEIPEISQDNTNEMMPEYVPSAFIVNIPNEADEIQIRDNFNIAMDELSRG